MAGVNARTRNPVNPTTKFQGSGGQTDERRRLRRLDRYGYGPSNVVSLNQPDLSRPGRFAADVSPVLPTLKGKNMIVCNPTVLPGDGSYNSGWWDRIALEREADAFLEAHGETVTQVDKCTGYGRRKVERERKGRRRLRVWSTEILRELGVEYEPVEYGTDGLEELLDQFPLTPLQKRVAFYVLDGRDHGRGYMTDVAEALGITPNSARVHWSTAKRKMQETDLAQAS